MDKTLIAGISFIASVILGFVWLQNYFVTAETAKSHHANIIAEITADRARSNEGRRETYLEVMIAISNLTMKILEEDGVDVSEQREYDLLKQRVEKMSHKLMELDQ